MRRVGGAELFSPYGVISALVRAMRYVLMLDGSASDAVASTSTGPLNLELVCAQLRVHAN